MIYIQYYTKDLSGKVVESVASDGVWRYDNRYSQNTMIQKARDNAKTKNERLGKDFVGFAFFRGESFSRASRVSEIYSV
jgi:hypothetical protein